MRFGTDPATGRRRTVKRTALTEHDAMVELARLQRQFGHATDVSLMTLDDYLALWLDDVRPTLRPATHESYAGHVRMHISPLLGGIRVGALHQRDVRRLIADRLRSGLSANTVVRIVATLRSALGQAVSDGDLAVNVAMVELPKVEREPVEAMTPELAQAILEAVRGTPHEALYVLLLGTGMRLGEACALDWRDLRLPKPGRAASGNESVIVRQGKSASATRRIPLRPFVVAALLEHRRRATRLGDDEPVFVGERSGERLRADHASHALPKLLAAAGLPALSPHALRHGTATLLLRQGVQMREIAEVLGHANPALTARVYAHVSEDSKKRAMSQLDDVAAPG
jgi:integrase